MEKGLLMCAVRTENTREWGVIYKKFEMQNI